MDVLGSIIRLPGDGHWDAEDRALRGAMSHVEPEDVAQALAVAWRHDSRDPDFNDPPPWIRKEVEEQLGEPIWR